MKKGDTFRWYYREPWNSHAFAYWAKSHLVTFDGDRLVERYWGAGGDNLTWTPDDARDYLELTFIGNLDDYENRPEHHSDYYCAGDCMNLNHANSSKGNFYVRRGASRSEPRMREIIQLRIEKAERERDSACRDISRYIGILGEIADGKSLDEIYL